MQKYAIIVAGGSGLRAGGERPKQFADLCGRPVLWWSMKAFKEADPDTRVVVVMNPDYFMLWEDLCDTLGSDRIEHTICCGGKTRTESVRSGLLSVRQLCVSDGVHPDRVEALVAVHDAARPLVSPQLISASWVDVCNGVGTLPAVTPVSSLREMDADGDSHPVDRALYREVQTPQVFTLANLWEGYRQLDDREYTDDATLMQSHGVKIRIIEGERENIKVTHPADFIIAKALIER